MIPLSPFVCKLHPQLLNAMISQCHLYGIIDNMRNDKRTEKNMIKIQRSALIASGLIAIALLCGGCASKIPGLEGFTEMPASLTPPTHMLALDSEGMTGAGIRVGSSYDEWASSYMEYPVAVLNGDTYEPYAFDIADPEEGEDSAAAGTEGDKDHDGTYMISAFYIDDEPTSVKELLNDTGKEPEELSDYLADPEYLSKHTVVYRYMIFTVKDDVISSIDADYLDYNEEL